MLAYYSKDFILIHTQSYQTGRRCYRGVLAKEAHTMGIWEIMVFTISLIIMMTGLAGIIVPIIPSIPLIWLGTFFYGLFTHFEKITWLTLAILAVVTIASIVFENLANIYGAKKFGATRWGIFGSIIGTGVGLYLGGPVGLILGPAIGTIVFEVVGGQSYKGALKSGLGNFVGFLGGSLLKIIIGLTMIAFFLWKVFG